MRNKLFLLALLAASVSLSAQVNINTNLTTGTMSSSVANLYRTAYLHFQLVNCGDNIPVMPGSANAIVQDSFDLRPSSPGSPIMGQIIGNDQITCGNVVSTYYQVTAMKDASHPLRDGIPYVICSATASLSTCSNQASLGTFNLITADPMTQPPPAPGFSQVVENPTNSQTIDQPAGTQLNFQGTVSFCSANVLCGSGGGGTPNPYGIDATTCIGLDASLQIQNCIYLYGGIINATRFTAAELATCSVNPFSTPGQTNPTDTTGLPAGGLLLLPAGQMFCDVPFLPPNKWQVRGSPGYGPYPNKTTISPSANFAANRPLISAAGTGTTGLSATGGLTVTITGTTLPACANLEGMFLLGASNASATAVPDSTNAMIGGAIIGCSGNTLTLSGAGASGTVTNAGWTIIPVIAGWMPGGQGYAVQGSAIEDLVISAQTPSASYVNPSICWLDVSGQEDSSLTRFGADYCNYMQIGVFTAGAQNGGPFTDLTLNTKGQGTNSSILVQLFGTGFNAAGGGSSGLCSPSNPCKGSSTRNWTGLTLLCDGTGVGTGCTGMDVAAINTKIGDGISHCEGCNVGVRIGYSGGAAGVTVAGFAGSSSGSSALTSAVDIALPYCNANPGPTGNITLANIAQGNGSTWNFRNFCNLTGNINDNNVGSYKWGAQGTAFTQVETNAQPLSCITTGGALDTNGAHCAANSEIIVSAVNGRFYADGFNNNGSRDDGQQISNALQYAYANGFTQGVIVDATGFNRSTGNPIGVCPWTGTIPASGVLELGVGAYFFSTGCNVPPNWLLKGQTPFGLGTGGATGTTLAPNVSNTVNANFANDSVTGTVSTTAGSRTVTGSGTNFSSAWVNHIFKACATLPCTTQSTMGGGVITAVASATSMTISIPAQSTLSGAAYTSTPTLLTVQGGIENITVDSNSFGVAGGVPGGFAGIGLTGTGAYARDITVSHVPDIGLWSVGLSSGNFVEGNLEITANGAPSSIFCGLCIPQGLSVNRAVIQTNTVTNPSLSYGVFVGGPGYDLHNLNVQNTKIGVEAYVDSTFNSNGNVFGIQCGTGSAAPTTCVDLAGVSAGGSNANAFAINLQNIGGGGSTTTVNEHLLGFTTTEPFLGWWNEGQQVAGVRNWNIDSHTLTQTSNSAGGAAFGGTLSVGSGGPTWGSTAGVPSGSCTVGSLDTNTSATTASTTLYVCAPANTWNAVTIP